MPFPLSTPPTPLTYFSSDRFDQILPQFLQAIVQAIQTSNPNYNQVRRLISYIQNSGIQTKQLTEMVYDLCSLVCKNYSALKYRKSTLLLCLEIGFRHLDHTEQWIEAKLVHTEHHQKLAEIVFGKKDGEAIADLICAWTSGSNSHDPYPLPQIYARYLTGLGPQCQSSPRLRECVIYVVRFVADQPLEQAEAGELVGLLNDLQMCGDMDTGLEWLKILLDVIQCSAKPQCLSHSYWELLLNHAAYWADYPGLRTYNPDVMTILEGSEEWDKLKCWIGVVWIMWPPGSGVTTEEELKSVMLSLSHQNPDVIQELEKQMEQFHSKWSQVEIPESFQQICKQAHDNMAQQSTL